MQFCTATRSASRNLRGARGEFLITATHAAAAPASFCTLLHLLPQFFHPSSSLMLKLEAGYWPFGPAFQKIPLSQLAPNLSVLLYSEGALSPNSAEVRLQKGVGQIS
jgi:hypothetical protein